MVSLVTSRADAQRTGRPRKRSPVTTSARPYRWFAAFAVVTLVVTQVGVLTHRAAVRHVRCAEHGELVDAPELDIKKIDNDSRLVGVVTHFDGGDSHCVLANHLRPNTVESCGFDAVANLPELPPVVPVLAPSHATIASYRIAPKTSPPV